MRELINSETQQSSVLLFIDQKVKIVLEKLFLKNNILKGHHDGFVTLWVDNVSLYFDCSVLFAESDLFTAISLQWTHSPVMKLSHFILSELKLYWWMNSIILYMLSFSFHSLTCCAFLLMILLTLRVSWIVWRVEWLLTAPQICLSIYSQELSLLNAVRKSVWVSHMIFLRCRIFDSA